MSSLNEQWVTRNVNGERMRVYSYNHGLHNPKPKPNNVHRNDKHFVAGKIYATKHPKVKHV